MFISYGFEAWIGYEDLTKTLNRLNKQLRTAGVLLIKQYDHK
jgi:23S rRNA maturation mini-RNase III